MDYDSRDDEHDQIANQRNTGIDGVYEAPLETVEVVHLGLPRIGPKTSHRKTVKYNEEHLWKVACDKEASSEPDDYGQLTTADTNDAGVESEA